VVNVELSFDMGAVAIMTLGVGVVALGLAQAVGETRFGWE